MTGDATRLLKRLEPAVRPVAMPGAAPPPSTRADAVGFDNVLALVSRGTITSGRAAHVAPDATLDGALDGTQLERVGAALDRVEAAGGRRALLLLDGRALVADVADRAIARELGADGAPLVGIDAAVWVQGTDGNESTVPRLPGGVVPASIASLFGDAT